MNAEKGFYHFPRQNEKRWRGLGWVGGGYAWPKKHIIPQCTVCLSIHSAGRPTVRPVVWTELNREEIETFEQLN